MLYPQYDALPANEQEVVDRKDLDPDIREEWIEAKKQNGNAAWQECLSLTSAGFPQLPYEAKRRRQYPPTGDQLDALYHAGIFPEDMAAQLKAVKDANPKPE